MKKTSATAYNIIVGCKAIRYIRASSPGSVANRFQTCDSCHIKSSAFSQLWTRRLTSLYFQVCKSLRKVAHVPQQLLAVRDRMPLANGYRHLLFAA
jgi:hypothetical protein